MIFLNPFFSFSCLFLYFLAAGVTKLCDSLAMTIVVQSCFYLRWAAAICNLLRKAHPDDGGSVRYCSGRLPWDVRFGVMPPRAYSGWFACATEVTSTNRDPHYHFLAFIDVFTVP